MSLPLALVFHFNQHTHTYIDLANRACYRGLLQVLRAHSQLKFNLHLSGTLLRALAWFDPQTLVLVRDGIAAGQFEILGSTYAQNVPYASDDWDNAEQIGLHREVLKTLLDVEPTTFWISERCWRQSLLPVICEAGYTLTLLEDHILQQAGLVDPSPARTPVGEQSLTCVYDDTILRERFNYAVWFGRRAQLWRYLDQLAERPASSQFLVAYAEDAEAMGLWNWERGYLPHAAWAHLDTLLTEIETTGKYALCQLSAARPHQDLPALPDGAARWMDSALLNPNLPYHEDGYQNWFDYNQRSPKVKYFRHLYDVLRANLQTIGSARSDPGFPRPAHTPGDRFYRQAIEAFCHHQYEFGCIGVGGRGYWGWEGVRWAFLLGRVAEIADDPTPRQWIEDVTGDGSDEQIICDGRQLFIFTARGARLIAWFDLVHGRQWVGNQLAIPDVEYVEHLTRLASPTPRPQPEWPETFTADLKPWKHLKTKEPRPTQLGWRFPAWLLEREPAELTVYPRDQTSHSEYFPPNAQRGALNNHIQLDDHPAPDLNQLLDYRFEPQGLCYLIFPLLTETDVVIEKYIQVTEAGLRVRYVLFNHSGEAHRLRLDFFNELCPDYAALLGHGRETLAFEHPTAQSVRVTNTLTHTAIELTSSTQWDHLDQRVNLLALEVAAAFDFQLAPHAQQEVTFDLRIISES